MKTDNTGLSLDSMIITINLDALPGGRTLNVEGFTDKVISAGHVVIKEDEKEVYKPLATTGKKPSGFSYVGYVIASKETATPDVGIMYAGTLNEAYSRYPIPQEAKDALVRVTVINQ